MSETQEQQPQVQPQVEPLVTKRVPQHADLLASPVRRIVYPSLYGLGPQLFTDLQKDAAIGNEFERLTRQIVFLQEDNQRLHSDNTTLVETLDTKETEVRTLQNRVDELEQDKLGLLSQLNDRNAQIEKLGRQTQLLTSQNDAKQKVIADLTAYQNKLKLHQDSLTQEVQQDHQREQQLVAQDQQTKDWNRQLTEDVTKLTALVDQGNVEVQRLNAVVTEANQHTEQVRLDLVESTKQVEVREVENARLNAECRQREAEVDTANNTILEREGVISDLQAEVQSLNAHVAQLESNLNSQVGLTLEKVNENKVLEGVVQTQVQEVQGLKADKVGLETNLQTLNAKNDDLAVNLSNTEAERQRVMLIANQRTNEVQTMATTVDALTTTPLYPGYGGYGLNGLNGLNGLGYNGLGLSTMIPPPSPGAYLARSYLGARF